VFFFFRLWQAFYFVGGLAQCCRRCTPQACAKSNASRHPVIITTDRSSPCFLLPKSPGDPLIRTYFAGWYDRGLITAPWQIKPFESFPETSVMKYKAPRESRCPIAHLSVQGRHDRRVRFRTTRNAPFTADWLRAEVPNWVQEHQSDLAKCLVMQGEVHARVLELMVKLIFLHRSRRAGAGGK